MDTVSIKLKMSEQTLESVHTLCNMTGIDNRAHIVASSIQLTEELVKSMVKDKAKVYIELPNGQRQIIKIIGM